MEQFFPGSHTSGVCLTQQLCWNGDWDAFLKCMGSIFCPLAEADPPAGRAPSCVMPFWDWGTHSSTHTQRDHQRTWLQEPKEIEHFCALQMCLLFLISYSGQQWSVVSTLSSHGLQDTKICQTPSCTQSRFSVIGERVFRRQTVLSPKSFGWCCLHYCPE